MDLKRAHAKLWTPHDEVRLRKAATYRELSRIALTILRRMNKPIGQVCGPISTGGTGSVHGNLERFQAAIRRLSAAGFNIFDQMPFEPPMWRINRTPYCRGSMHLLEEFYLPIFKSGLISTLFFLNSWETSVGASWEHEQAIRLNLKIVYLTG